MSKLREFAETKVGSALILAGLFAVIGIVSGVSALPANDARQDTRIAAVEVKAEATDRKVEKNGADTAAELKYMNRVLDDIVKKLDRIERRHPQ